MKENTESEIERIKVERAEDSIYQGYEFSNVKEAKLFLDDLKDNHQKWWSQNLNQIKNINIVLDPEIALDKTIIPEGNENYDVITAQQEGLDVTLIISTEKVLKEFPLISTITRMALSEENNNSDKINFNGLEYRKLILDACLQLLDETFYNDLRNAFINEGLTVS